MSVRRVLRLTPAVTLVLLHPNILRTLAFSVLPPATASLLPRRALPRGIQVPVTETITSEGLRGQVVPGLGLHLAVLHVDGLVGRLRLLRVPLVVVLGGFDAHLPRGVAGAVPVQGVRAQGGGVAVRRALARGGGHHVADLAGGARVQAALADQAGPYVEIPANTITSTQVPTEREIGL